MRLDGGLSGRLSPALYVLVALVAAFARPLAGILVVVWILALEAGLRLASRRGPTELGGLRHARRVRRHASRSST